MIIAQRRINGTSKLKRIEEGKTIRVIVRKPDSEILEKMGFNSDISVGYSILPNIVGPASKLNAEGKYDIHKDREKETCYRMLEWTYQQFCGRGQTVK